MWNMKLDMSLRSFHKLLFFSLRNEVDSFTLAMVNFLFHFKGKKGCCDKSCMKLKDKDSADFAQRITKSS